MTVLVTTHLFIDRNLQYFGIRLNWNTKNNFQGAAFTFYMALDSCIEAGIAILLLQAVKKHHLQLFLSPFST